MISVSEYSTLRDHVTTVSFGFSYCSFTCSIEFQMALLAQGRHARQLREVRGPRPGQGSEGIACLTLLVQRRFSSDVTNNVATCGDPRNDEIRRKYMRRQVAIAIVMILIIQILSIIIFIMQVALDEQCRPTGAAVGYQRAAGLAWRRGPVLCVYIYIYMCMYVCMYIYIYIHMIGSSRIRIRCGPRRIAASRGGSLRCSLFSDSLRTNDSESLSALYSGSI